MIPTFVYYLAPAVFLLICVRRYREKQWGKCRNTEKLTYKVAIVTGANSGIGYEISKELRKRGAYVIMACRNENAALKAISKIGKELKSESKLRYMHLDLASFYSIKEFAHNFHSRFGGIDILINNAGVYFDDKADKKTENGLEIHYGVNYVGHFLLTILLLDRFNPKSRIVILTSMAHKKGKIYFENLNLKTRDEAKNLYANSKLANLYFCSELERRIYHRNISVYAASPGWVWTSLFRNQMWRMAKYFIFILPAAFLFMRSAKQGAQTPIFCATAPDISHYSGSVFRDCRILARKSEFDCKVAKRLWRQTVKVIESKGISLKGMIPHEYSCMRKSNKRSRKIM